MKMKKIFNLLPKSLKIIVEDYFRRKRNIKSYNPKQYLNPKFESSFKPFDYYKCIFVHIPKNAGLSVSYTLFGNTGGSHRKIINYQDFFAPQTFRRYYKFAFVRNPWDRLVSTYSFLMKGGISEKDRKWAEENIMHYPDFETFVKEWLNDANIRNSLHFQYQHLFLEDKNGKLAVDFIGRFENITEDFKIIAKQLGINRELKKTNSSQRDKDYKQYYTEETMRIVENVYKQDIKLFNYKF